MMPGKLSLWWLKCLLLPLLLMSQPHSLLCPHHSSFQHLANSKGPCTVFYSWLSAPQSSYLPRGNTFGLNQVSQSKWNLNIFEKQHQLRSEKDANTLDPYISLLLFQRNPFLHLFFSNSFFLPPFLFNKPLKNSIKWYQLSAIRR